MAEDEVADILEEEAPPIAIVGGGPTGMALALALAGCGHNAHIFEARERAAAPERIMALSHGSRQILEWLGVWRDIAAAPIAAIHVSQAGSLGRTRFAAADAGVPALGYVMTAASLAGALDQALARADIAVHEHAPVERVADTDGDELVVASRQGETRARLVVYADGGLAAAAGVIERPYGQHAVICRASGYRSHDNIAYERFTKDGSFALLPLQEGGSDFAVIYVCQSALAEAVLAEDDAAFVARLTRELGSRHEFVDVSPRQAYPLVLRYRASPVGPRRVWLGNAAQTLHPIAGQGYNLALRDIYELARCLKGLADPGDAAALRRYADARRADRMSAIHFTDGLVRLFSQDWPLVRHGRSLGLLVLDLVPPAREFFARRMMYGARAWL